VATATGSIQSITRQYPLADLLSIRLPLALLLILPVFAPAIFPTSRLLSLAVTAAIYVIVANGLHVVFSYAGQLSLAQTALWGLGAYASALLLNHFGLPTLVLIPVAGLIAALGAVLIGIPAFRTAGFSFAIITFAFAEIMLLVANNWDDLTNGSIGITILDPPDAIGPIEFDTFNHLDNFYHLTLAFSYLSLLGIFLIRQSSLGKTFIAIRENEALAKSVGINVYSYKLIAFAISGFYAGVAGVFFMYHQKHIDPGPLSAFAAFATIQFLLMILMGGRRSMLGPTIGAIVVVFGPEVVNALLGDWLTFNRSQMIFGAVLALSVLTAPNGIAGQTRDGYNTFVATLRSSRGRGHNTVFAFFYALSRATIPARFRPRDDAVEDGDVT
jgi:branched-chain amino acid transport system permease protein